MVAMHQDSRLYAVYFRPKANSSLADVACVRASSLDSAKAQASAAVAKLHPGGKVIGVVLAERSPYPLMDVEGRLVAPSAGN
jgi:hypothetical protein